jgi:hypothetical protein
MGGPDNKPGHDEGEYVSLIAAWCNPRLADATFPAILAPKEAAMSDILTPLTIDFLVWLAAKPRDYIDVMDAWRTSCPRLTIWEDAIDANLITRVHTPGQPTRIEVTQQGKALLATNPR